MIVIMLYIYTYITCVELYVYYILTFYVHVPMYVYFDLEGVGGKNI